MKGKPLAVLLPALLVLLFAGCSMILEREYRSVEPHLEQREESDTQEYLTASTYAELREAILRLVSQAREEGTIRVYHSYSGSLSRDVPQAIYEVMQEEPLGAYAVEYIPYEAPVRFLNYNEVHLSISYRVSPEKIRQIRSGVSLGELGELLGQTMKRLETSLVVECAYYDESIYDIPKLVERQFLADPGNGIYQPGCTVNTYPREGQARILEVELDYGADLLDIQKYRRDLELASQALREQTEELSGEDLVRAVTAWALAGVEPDQQSYESYYSGREDVVKDLGFSAYGPICQGAGTPEGVALAAKLLCEQQGMETLVVCGTRGDRPYHWNMVKVDGTWQHWDLYQLLRGGSILLQGDESMSESCQWTPGSVPSSQAETVYYDSGEEEN